MPPSLASIIKRLRKTRGLTQAQVEYLSKGKIKRDWLASFERGRIKRPPPEKLEPLAALLNTTVLEIYREAGIVDIPYPPESSAKEQELLEDFRNLTPEQQQEAINLIRLIRKASHIEIEPGPLGRPSSEQKSRARKTGAPS